MQKVTINNLFDYNFLSSITANKDGSRLIFTKTTAKEESNDYFSSLYMLETATNKITPITSNGKERTALWLDNDTILFGKADGKDKTSYYKLNVTGGEAEKAFTIPCLVSSIKVLSDNLYLITSTKTAVENEEAKENRAKQGEDFYIFDELPFWKNGQGVTNKKRNSLMIYSTKTEKFTEISDKFMDVSGVCVSDNGSKVLFWGENFSDIMTCYDEVLEYNVASGFTKTILEKNKLSIHFVKYYMDKVLIEGSDLLDNSSQNPKLYILENDNLKEFADLDGSLRGSSGSDMGYGGGNAFNIIGSDIYALFTSWGNSYLSKLDEKASLNFINETVGSISCFDIIGNTAYCIAMRDYAPQEIYTIDLTTGEETQISHFNSEFMSAHSVCKPEYFTFTSKEGHELEGWVIKPVDYDPNKKYPGILSVHGGPKVVFGANYHHEMQCLANMGMFIFYTNPRGADGRGEAFSRLVGNLGVIDFADLMEFTDKVLELYSAIDSDRLGIMGGSYGGFMCNWVIGNTNRFKAAASQRSISNYFSKCLTTDIGYYHNLSQVDASPWNNSEKMWFHSPLKYIKNATTATLFIQSDEDYRCWMSDPIQMFTALRQRSIPSKICLFHGENHELSRAGKPKNRINRLKEICNWFEKYL